MGFAGKYPKGQFGVATLSGAWKTVQDFLICTYSELFFNPQIKSGFSTLSRDQLQLLANFIRTLMPKQQPAAFDSLNNVVSARKYDFQSLMISMAKIHLPRPNYWLMPPRLKVPKAA